MYCCCEGGDIVLEGRGFGSTDSQGNTCNLHRHLLSWIKSIVFIGTHLMYSYKYYHQTPKAASSFYWAQVTKNPCYLDTHRLGSRRKTADMGTDKSWLDYQYKGDQTGTGAHIFSCLVGGVGSFPAVKMAILHLMPMLWMGGILTPLPHVPCRNKYSSFVVWPLLPFWLLV